jgi:hypothetical protein
MYDGSSKGEGAGYRQMDQGNSDNQNWYELRIQGKFPERRAYHSCFTFGKK